MDDEYKPKDEITQQEESNYDTPVIQKNSQEEEKGYGDG